MEIMLNLRLEKGWTQKEMAEYLEESLSLYEKVENGYREMSRRFMRKLKNKFPELDMNIFFI